MSHFSIPSKPRKASCFLVFMAFSLGSVFLSNCASSNATTNANNQTEFINRMARTSPSYVVSEVFPIRDTSNTQPILVTTVEIRRDYEEISIIRIISKVGSTTYLSDLYESFREEARKIGAEAVIRVQFGSSSVGYSSYPWAVGTAVKYR
ncbi:MAG: heavy metal-binding domain-containing protein [Candidatus Kapabacteria bacterium]|jgi:hypothetical protein|nr:heavy metal-binding domain-containing protein [Candidatus Kapabacteria bacterium]